MRRRTLLQTRSAESGLDSAQDRGVGAQCDGDTCSAGRWPGFVGIVGRFSRNGCAVHPTRRFVAGAVAGALLRLRHTETAPFGVDGLPTWYPRGIGRGRLRQPPSGDCHEEVSDRRRRHAGRAERGRLHRQGQGAAAGPGCRACRRRHKGLITPAASRKGLTALPRRRRGFHLRRSEPCSTPPQAAWPPSFVKAAEDLSAGMASVEQAVAP